MNPYRENQIENTIWHPMFRTKIQFGDSDLTDIIACVDDGELRLSITRRKLESHMTDDLQISLMGVEDIDQLMALLTRARGYIESTAVML